MSSFCICKSYSHFFSKNSCELDIVFIRTVNILTTNQLVKLTMLWTTGPCFKSWIKGGRVHFRNMGMKGLTESKFRWSVKAVGAWYFSYFSTKTLWVLKESPHWNYSDQILEMTSGFSSIYTSERTFGTSCLLSCTPRPFWKGVFSKRKEFSPIGVDSFSEGRQTHFDSYFPRKWIYFSL